MLASGHREETLGSVARRARCRHCSDLQPLIDCQLGMATSVREKGIAFFRAPRSRDGGSVISEGKYADRDGRRDRREFVRKQGGELVIRGWPSADHCDRRYAATLANAPITKIFEGLVFDPDRVRDLTRVYKEVTGALSLETRVAREDAAKAIIRIARKSPPRWWSMRAEHSDHARSFRGRAPARSLIIGSQSDRSCG